MTLAGLKTVSTYGREVFGMMVIIFAFKLLIFLLNTLNFTSKDPTSIDSEQLNVWGQVSQMKTHAANRFGFGK